LQDFSPKSITWPIWVSNVTNLSHLALTFASSANFFIYFAMHSQNLRGWVAAVDRDGSYETFSAEI
jgi:hypothetical protein